MTQCENCQLMVKGVLHRSTAAKINIYKVAILNKCLNNNNIKGEKMLIREKDLKSCLSLWINLGG